MIIKVKNSKEAWSYFECDIVHSKYEAYGKIESKADYVVLFENKDIKNDIVVKLLNLETKESHLRTILTDRVCYILNNDGKTIDKL